MAQEYELVKGFETENGTGLYDYEALANKPGVVSTGAPGFAPQLDGKTSSFLRGDGTWATPPNTTYNEATQSAAGLMSAADKKKVDGMGTTISNAINAIDYPVDSVNNKTGKVVLNYDDVDAVSWNEYASAIVQKADVVKEAKGDLITISDSAEAPLQGLKIFGKTEQVTTTGKNLFSLAPFEPVSKGGITASYENGGIRISGNLTDTESNFPIVNLGDVVTLPAGVYTVSFNTLSQPQITLRFITTPKPIDIQNVTERIKTLTLTESTPVQCIVYRNSKYAQNISSEPIFTQIEAGSTATEWEPYTGGIPAPNPDYPQKLESPDKNFTVTVSGENVQDQTLLVSTLDGLPGIPVSSDGNYRDENDQWWICDEVDFEKGVYVQRVRSVAVTQTASQSNSLMILPDTAGAKRPLAIVSNYTDGAKFGLSDDGEKIFIRGSENASVNKVNLTYTELNALLVETPMVLVYALAEEKHIPLSEIDPDALAQYATLHTNHPNTTVFNDGNAGMEVKYATPTTALPLTGGRYKVATPYAPTDAVPKSYADRIDKKVDTLREVVSSFHSNIVQEASGEVIQVYGSAEAPLTGLRVFGKTEQVTTTGKNLLDQHSSNWKEEHKVLGITYSFIRDSNGNLLYINANGTADTGGKSSHCKKSFTLLPAGTYIISGAVKQSDNSTGLRIGKGPNADYVGLETGDGYKITLTEETYIAINPIVGPGQKVSNLKFYPMIRLASETDATYEPYTGGIPSPNPDYPQALESVGDSVTVTVCGKNLVDITKAVTDRASMELKSDGEIRVYSDDAAGTYKGASIKQFVMRAGQSYTLSADVKSVARNAGIALRKVSDSFIIGSGAWCNVAKTLSLTRTVDVDTEVFVSLFVCGAEAGSGDNTFANVQVELGSTATAYEPYKEPNTVTVLTPNGLPGIPVTSGGNYTDPVTGKQWICDEVDFEKCVYLQRVKEINFSNITWTYSSEYNMWVSPNEYKDGVNSALLCETLPHNLINLVGTTLGTRLNAPYNIWVRNGSSINSPAGKALYILAQENPIPLSEIDPDALTEYAKLHSNYPNTTVFNDAGADMEVKYVADTKMYVDKKFEELAEILINKL